MSLNIIVTIVGLIASSSSIIFALFTFKKAEREEHKKNGKNEGLILSDIGYIKACVDRVEKNLGLVDERYRDAIERLATVEGRVISIEKRINQTGG